MGFGMLIACILIPRVIALTLREKAAVPEAAPAAQG